MLSLVLLVATVQVWADEAGFSRTLAPGDFKATGLDRLTPAQRQRLDELIASYQQGAVVAAQRSAAEALAAKQAAEAEAKAARAEVADSKKSNQGFLAKAKVLLVPGTKIEYAVVKSTIAGQFEGWDGSTIFTLANGQRWQVRNHGDRYFTPPESEVEVEVSPATLGGYWMDFPSLKVRVRVKWLSGN